MNNLYARLSIISLAVLFLCGNLLNYPFYRFAVSQAKEEIRRELFGRTNETGSVTLSFTKEEYAKAAVETRELCVNGNWYDVISRSETADGRILVKCFADKKESLLHAWFQHVNNENGDPAAPVKGGKQLKLAFSGDYMPASFHTLSLNPASGPAVGAAPLFAPVSGGHTNLPEMPPRA